MTTFSIPDDRTFATIGACSSPSSRRADHLIPTTHVTRIRGRLLLACCGPMDRVRIYVPLHEHRLLPQRAQFIHAHRAKRQPRETSRTSPSPFAHHTSPHSPQRRAPSSVALSGPSFVLRARTRAWHAPRKGSPKNGAAEINRVAPTDYMKEGVPRASRVL